MNRHHFAALFLVALILRFGSLLAATSALRLPLEEVASFQDGPSYLYLATHLPLYPERESVILFPLFPVVISVLAWWMPPPAAGLTVSMVAGSAAVALYGVLLRQLTPHWFWVSLLFSVFPFRWFNLNQLVMSESLFLMLVLLSFHIGGRRPLLAGSCLGLACLTRLTGIFLIPALFARIIAGSRRLRAAVLASAISILFQLLFWTYLYFRFGSPGAYFEEHEKYWGGDYFAIPFSSLLSGFTDPHIFWLRKPYVAFLLIFYGGGIWLAIKSFRKDPSRLFLLLWLLPFVLAQSLLRGGDVNWGFISYSRIMVPAAPAVLLLWAELLSPPLLLRAFWLLLPLAFVYTMVEFRLQ
ncbi:MAG: DUF2029 domain-containing protein [Acidobacteria bacterium]|nr:DUF2029 domain-containing protein [Acidobacteriota bacterium]